MVNIEIKELKDMRERVYDSNLIKSIISDCMDYDYKNSDPQCIYSMDECLSYINEGVEKDITTTFSVGLGVGLPVKNVPVVNSVTVGGLGSKSKSKTIQNVEYIDSIILKKLATNNHISYRVNDDEWFFDINELDAFLDKVNSQVFKLNTKHTREIKYESDKIWNLLYICLAVAGIVGLLCGIYNSISDYLIAKEEEAHQEELINNSDFVEPYLYNPNDLYNRNDLNNILNNQ